LPEVFRRIHLIEPVEAEAHPTSRLLAMFQPKRWRGRPVEFARFSGIGFPRALGGRLFGDGRRGPVVVAGSHRTVEAFVRRGMEEGWW
jgi:hypothetical protein